MSAEIVDLKGASCDVSITTLKFKRKINKKLKEIGILEEKDSSSLTEPEKVKIGKKELFLKQLEDIGKGNDTKGKSKEKTKGKRKGNKKSKGKKKSGTSKTFEQLEQEQLEFKLEKEKKSSLRKLEYTEHYREKERIKDEKLKQQQEIKQREQFKVMIITACNILELNVFNLNEATINEATIKSQYDKLIKKYDPIKTDDNIKVKQINEAYKFLTDRIEKSKHIVK